MTGTNSIKEAGPKRPRGVLALGAAALMLALAGLGLVMLDRPRPTTQAVLAPPPPLALDLARAEFPPPAGTAVNAERPTLWMKDSANAAALADATLKIARTDARAIRRLPYYADIRIAVDRAFDEGMFNNYAPSIIGDDIWSIVNGDLYRQNGKMRVIDTSTVTGLSSYSFENFVPSPDGRHVGFVVSDAGSEFGYARILEVATGRVLPEVYGPMIGDGSFDWIDNASFAYTRTPTTDLRHGDPSANNVAYLARVGEPGPGRPVLGPGVGTITVEGRYTPALWGARPNSENVLGVVYGVTTAEFWLTQRAALIAGRPQWKRLATFNDDVDDATPFYRWVILVRAGKDGLPELDAYDVATGATKMIRAGSRDLIFQSSWASDHMAYVFARSGVSARLFQLDPELNLKEIKLPFEGALSEFSGVYGRSDQLTFKLSSVSEPEHFIEVRDGVARVIAVAPDGEGGGAVKSSTEFAVSADGTKVPMTIVEPAKRAPRPDAPTLLHGYGAYGVVEMNERSPAITLWASLGGVDANCHVRGGGYYGKPWHDAGRGPDKTKAHEDLIACAEHLIASGRAQPHSLAVTGASAGGMVAGPAALKRPDLFRAAVFDYAELNPLDSYDQPNGSAQIDEYGDASKPEDAAKLRLSDSVALGRTAKGAPDMLFCFGLQDRRVSYWESTRLASTVARRFPTANVAILADKLAGHSCGFATSSHEMLALKYAWLLAELDPKRTTARP